MPRTKLLRGSVPVTFRLPREVQKLLLKKARREEVSFSEVVRRALRREIQADKAFAKQYGPNGSRPA